MMCLRPFVVDRLTLQNSTQWVLRNVGRRGNELGGGLNLLVGIEHRDGFFGEVTVGLIDSPGVKVGVGFSFAR